MKRQIVSIRGFSKQVESIHAGLFGETQEQLISLGSRFVQSMEMDRDAVVRPLLELEFENAKEMVVNAVREIQWHSTDPKWGDFVAEFVRKRPNLLFGQQTGFQSPFWLAIDEMRTMGIVLRSLVDLQVLREPSELGPKEMSLSRESGHVQFLISFIVCNSLVYSFRMFRSFWLNFVIHSGLIVCCIPHILIFRFGVNIARAYGQYPPKCP
jgi:hypothetical protein